MSSNINLLLILALVILIASTPNYVAIPAKFHKLISDKNNAILLLGLCFLVSYYNFNIGVLLAIFLFVVMINPMHIEKFENNNTTTNNTATNNTATNNTANNNTANNTATSNNTATNNTANNTANNTTNNAVVNNAVKNTTIDECDGVMYDDYDKMEDLISNLGNTMADLEDIRSNGSGGPSSENAKEFCGKLKEVNEHVEAINNNMKYGESFNAINDIVDDISNNLNNNIENFANRDIEENFMGATSDDAPLAEQENDVNYRLDEQLRQNCGMKKSNDFDLVGCKYDLNGNFDNEFIQGPPLAKCNIYNTPSVAKIGTEFYPINP